MPPSVECYFGRARAYGIDQAAVDIEIAVGVDAVVVGAARIDVAAIDGDVLRRIDSIVVSVDEDFATTDFEGVLALYAFAVGASGGDFYFAAADDNATAVGVTVAILRFHSSLDALGRRIVVATNIVGVARVVGVLGRAVVVVERAAGGDGDTAIGDG